ncbi:flagellar FlbD family protein [Arthrobacter sp. SX1312]|uniref:flagellar FlbD family protein n=1 Tax=Arthrobacter sp. SX1312 TaxID=2058896 RepID=UPI000CE2E865|nr:flagellar FlbD family protein [Arthrobacter sp. SX1312]
MIVVTRLNESQFAVNPDLIERIHENPDTTLVMVDGAKYIVTESLIEVIELIAAYRARIISLARFMPGDPFGDPSEGRDQAAQRPLGLVRNADTAAPTDTSQSGSAGTEGAGQPVQFRPRTT